MPVISKQEAIQDGYPKGEYFPQTILVPKTTSKRQAIAWLKQHGYKHGFYRHTPKFHRFMQTNPVRGSRYITKQLDPDIDLVLQKFN